MKLCPALCILVGSLKLIDFVKHENGQKLVEPG